MLAVLLVVLTHPVMQAVHPLVLPAHPQILVAKNNSKTKLSALTGIPGIPVSAGRQENKCFLNGSDHVEVVLT